jgi:hypothetical protein
MLTILTQSFTASVECDAFVRKTARWNGIVMRKLYALRNAVLAPSSQNRLPARKVGWIEDATEKLICHMLINALTNPYE